MYYIKKSEWKELEKEHSDYCGKSINNPEIHVIFEAPIPGNNGKGGTTLLFEGKHFQIVDDEKFTERKTEEPENSTVSEEEITENLWTAACGGDIETLKAYYMNGGKIGRTYERFGIHHSLIAGAYRTGHFKIVRYLLEVGEKPKDYEKDVDLKALYMDEVIEAAENLIDYFKYQHNEDARQKNQRPGKSATTDWKESLTFMAYG